MCKRSLFVHAHKEKAYFNRENTTHMFIIQESLANAKVSARQQCVYEDP